MLDWHWKVTILKAVLILCCVDKLSASDNVQKLPFCNPANIRDGPAFSDLMIVSTLDGKLTAFSTQNGLKAWSVETQPLLSSNLHNLELTSGGKWVRLVPSLRGTLYTLSGDTIEPLPFDAEQLLSSSYKYSDDLVIAGAKETVWLGIDGATGSVIYECGSSGCNSEHTSNARDVLVLRRHSNTVRALDPRAGTEKWNFSVAEHQLALNRGSCVGAAAVPATPVAVTVALHDARVALRVPGADRLIWQQKLEAPVAGMWRLQGGSLQNIDVLWEATQSISSELTAQPSLYIGVHDTQLYVQESPLYANKLETAVSASPVPWKLVAGRPLLEDKALLQGNDNQLSQVALYGSKGMVGDYGLFLYLQETCDQSVQTSDDDFRGQSLNQDDIDNDHHHIHVHVYSLWFWWKEVLLIAVSSALLLNLMIWPRLFPPKTQELGKAVEIIQHYERYPAPLPPPPPILPSVPEYSGRYNTDFTPLRCLGRGGFGVVFEVRNNIDHCSYAVKRITLPNKESKRERVLREVRALAKLDHVNIVRYFNAWVEREPPEWQMQRDKALIRELESHSMLSDDYTTTHNNISTPVKSPITSDKAKGDSVILNLQKHFDSEFDYVKMPEPSKRNSSPIHVHGAGRRPPGSMSLPAPQLSITMDVKQAKLGPSLSCSDSIIFDSNVPPEHTIPSNSVVRSSSQEQGHSEAKHNSVDKRLERVIECDYKTDTTSCVKKKKGHTRHWSLDACVKTNEPPLYLYIQMQLCRRDSLHDWLRNNRSIDKRPHKQIKSLFSQIVSAVDYVHRAGLIHRDLKPSNILFSQDGTVKVGDFGLVTSMGDTSQDGEPFEEADVGHQRHTYRVGTHLYMSPEQAMCKPYSYKVDIYSLGLILLEMLQPFGTEAERVRCLRDARRGDLPSTLKINHPDETKALELMLSEDPSQRPTAAGVRARAPLSEINDAQFHFTLPPIC